VKPLHNGTLYEPNTVMSVPLKSMDSKTYGVLVLYNKIGPNQQFSFYTDSDIALIDACSLLIGRLRMSYQRIEKL
jgi:hypothetical protein